MLQSGGNTRQRAPTATIWSARLCSTDVRPQSSNRRFTHRLVHGLRRSTLRTTPFWAVLLMAPVSAFGTAQNCGPFDAALVTSDAGFIPLQSARQQPDSNFVGARAVLAGATRCRVYHNDDGTYHSYDCNFYAGGEEQAKAIYDDWVTKARICAGSALTSDSSDTSRRVLASTKFKLRTEDGTDPRIRVSHRVGTDGAQFIEVGLASNTPEPIGSDGARATSPTVAASTDSLADETARLLEQLNADAVQSGLWLAASEGRVADVRKALEAGAKPDGKPGEFVPPLGAAVSGEHADVVEMLLAAGANVNVAAYGEPLIELALNRQDMLRLLLSKSTGRIDTALKAGQTANPFGPPLIRMIAYSDPALDPALLELFLSRADGIDLNAKDVLGRTALEIAADKPELLAVLLRYRVSPR